MIPTSSLQIDETRLSHSYMLLYSRDLTESPKFWWWLYCFVTRHQIQLLYVVSSLTRVLVLKWGKQELVLVVLPTAPHLYWDLPLSWVWTVVRVVAGSCIRQGSTQRSKWRLGGKWWMPCTPRAPTSTARSGTSAERLTHVIDPKS